MNLESHLYNILYEIPFPLESQLIQFSIGCNSNRIYMPNISQKFTTDLPFYDLDMFEFFRLLGVTNALNLFTTTLLEHQILLYSTNLERLMLIGESLTTLLFPFTWLEPYVPIVPSSNLHFIEAPVPYIMGFHSNRGELDKEDLRQGQKCFVDIDSGTIQVPEGVPDFPDKNKFIKEINELIQYFNQRKLKLTSKQNEEVNSGSNSARNDSLKNSQAYSRINELALRVGAIQIPNNNNNSSSLNDSSSLSELSSSSIDSLDFVMNEQMLNAQFIRAIRELFVSKFVQIFTSYEKFVILPTTITQPSNGNNNNNNTNTTTSSQDQFLYDIESYWLNKDYSGNFDSKMFLIEQPSPRLPFLSHFIETQMFVRFIDLKVLSILELKQHAAFQMKNKETLINTSFDPNSLIDPHVRIFDERIKQYKELEYDLNNRLKKSSELNHKLNTIDLCEIGKT
jgi:hypothetical protein